MLLSKSLYLKLIQKPYYKKRIIYVGSDIEN